MNNGKRVDRPQDIKGVDPASGGVSLGTADSHYDSNQGTVIFNITDFPQEEKQSSAQPALEVVKGSASPGILKLGKEKISIGRASYNDLIVSDKKVSRSHAAIYFEKGRYVIEDLNSTNGVYVEDQLVKRVTLKSGNRIALGDCTLSFTQPEPEIPLPAKIAFISNNNLFSWLDGETKALLAGSLSFKFFPKGAILLRQNTPSESMYFLYTGSIRAVEVNEEGGERVVDELKPGDFFGEKALLSGEPGKYSLIANSDSSVLELRREHLNELLIKKPELNKAFYRMVLNRLGESQIRPAKNRWSQERLRQLVISTEVEIVGEDKKIRDARKKVEALAGENKPVLILGPSGTGKRSFARYYHKHGKHPEAPYVEISLAELDRTKVGPAIFGIESDPEATHMHGQVGYLEMIGEGTLSIAHAEQLDAHQQSKLVTYFKQGWFHRVYGRETVKGKTTVVLLATGSEAEVLDKLIPELKELLKDRMVYLPPLSQRLKDIPLLAEHFLNLFAKREGKQISGLSREAKEKLVTYNWPGNIRELENVIQRAAIVSSEDVIIPGDLIFVIPSEKEIHKINVLRTDRVRAILRHPLVPKLFVWFNIAMVILMAGFTLFGGSRPEGHPLQSFGNNPGMLVTWLIWFPILPISAFLIGRIWCGVCPIAGIAEIASRIKKCNYPVPKILKRMDFWMVVVSFLFLDFVEEFLGVADKPWATGMLLVTIISVAAIFCILFERKTFCRYVCPLAGMLGAYSTMSVFEVRGNKRVCQTQCGQHTCFKGTDAVPGCPMFSYPASLTTNSECMMCLNCLKNCENRGVQLNLRPPLQEIWHQAQPALSLSLFGVMLVGLMARHQFPMLTYWHNIQESLAWPEWLTHSILFVFFLSFAIVAFLVSSTLSAAASQERVSENMAHYGLAFIPLALAGHLAHIAHEFLGEGVYELLQYPVKLYHSVIGGLSIGSREVAITHFIHGSVITFIKFMVVTGGMFGALIALVMIARKWSERNVFGRIMPHLLLVLFFYGVYLFIFLSSTGPATAQGASAANVPVHSGQAELQPPAVNPLAPSGGQTSAGGLQTVFQRPPVQASRAPAADQPMLPSATPVSFIMTSPALNDAASAPLSAPAVSIWLRSGKPVPKTKQVRLTLAGQVAGAPSGSIVRAYSDTDTAAPFFSSSLDAGGGFSGDIVLDSVRQKIPLVLQLIDPKTNSVIHTHRILLY